MRALTRMRTLAAVCALLLMLAGTAMARLPGSPIDRGEPTQNPVTQEVGEPDTGQNLVVGWYFRLILATQMSNPYLRGFAYMLWAHRTPSVGLGPRTAGR